MTPALTLSRPMTMTTSSRVPPAALWLFALLPGNAVVVVELLGGHFWPAVWLARFSPVLAVLAVVGVAQAHRGALGVRLRKELRLLLPMGLGLLLNSALPQVAPLLEGRVPGAALLSFMPWVLCGVLASSVLLTPLVREVQQDTLAALLVSPRGARAVGEKYALASLLVVASWALLSLGAPLEGELWWFALAGHLLPLVTVPTWFFLTRGEATSLGLVTIAPFAVVAVPVLLGAGQGVVIALLAAYALVVLAALPRAVRRGLYAPAMGEGSDVPGVRALERRGSPLVAALIREQRESVMLALLVLCAPLGVWANGGLTEAPYVAFVLSMCLAALSPGLSFSEARRVGTLDHHLSLRPRAEVLLQRAAASLVATLVGAGLGPLLLLLAMGAASPDGAATWLLAVLEVWALALLFATHARSAGTALVGGLGLAVLVFASALALYLLTSWGLGQFVAGARLGGRFLAPSFIVAGLLALALTWWSFVHQPRSVTRGVVLAALASLFSTAVFGVASALS